MSKCDGRSVGDRPPLSIFMSEVKFTHRAYELRYPTRRDNLTGETPNGKHP